MKRYIISSQALPFPENGSAPEANKRAGLLKYGTGQVITLNNGGQFRLLTGKVMFNSSTGETITSLNVFVKTKDTYLPEGAEYPTTLFKEFFSYTPDEVEELYNTVRAMSKDELREFLIKYAEDWHAKMLARRSELGKI